MSSRRCNSYITMHQRLSRAYGPANRQDCWACGEPGAAWAYDHLDPEERVETYHAFRGLTWSPKDEHYMVLCTGCHRELDNAPEDISD